MAIVWLFFSVKFYYKIRTKAYFFFPRFRLQHIISVDMYRDFMSVLKNSVYTWIDPFKCTLHYVVYHETHIKKDKEHYTAWGGKTITYHVFSS